MTRRGSVNTQQNPTPAPKEDERHLTKHFYDLNYSVRKRHALAAAKMARRLARECRERYGVNPTLVDIGPDLSYR
jgi:hypothetical protein